MLGNNNHTQPTFGARRTTWTLKTCILAGWRNDVRRHHRCLLTSRCLQRDVVRHCDIYIAMSGACPPQRHVDITCPISSRVPMWLAVTFSVRLNKMSAVWAQLFDGVISARGIFGRYTNNNVECYDMCNSTQNNVSSCLFPKFCQTRIRIHRTLWLQHENVCLNNL